MKRPSAAIVISVIALVFAMTGTGLAATKVLITSTTQIAPKVRAALRGPQGKQGQQGDQGQKGDQGVAGPAGSPGAPGAQGAQGVKGDTGTTGASGANGANGVSPTVATVASGVSSICAGAGGASITDASDNVAYACSASSLSSGSVQVVQNNIALQPGAGSVSGTATCPAGTVVTGGGYAAVVPDPDIDVTESSPNGTSGWNVQAQMAAGGPSDGIGISAICVTTS